MPQLLAATAQARRAAVAHQAALVVDRSADAGAFLVAAGGAVMGTAVKSFKMQLFLREGAVLCARGLAEANPRRARDVTPEKFYADAQGRHYAMRNAFEDYWVDGRKAIYFSLLLDGLGPPDYGEFTLVVDPDAVATADLACFPGNTAERYAPAGTLDEGLCLSEIAPWGSRAELLTIKHGSEVATDPTRWGGMVCSAGDFSETVVVARLPLTAVREIRIDAKKHSRWEDLRWRKLSGVGVSADQEVLVEALDVLDAFKVASGARIVGI